MSLLPSTEEVTLQCLWVEEAVKLFGTECVLWTRKDRSMYYDAIDLADGYRIRVLLDNNPTKRILDNLGWYKEFKDSALQLVYIPYTINGVPNPIEEGSVLVFEDRTSLQVSALNRNFLYGLWYIARCIPYERDTVTHTKYDNKQQMGVESMFLKQDLLEVDPRENSEGDDGDGH